MSTALSTLLLDLSSWDLVLDASGNIAVASPPYSTNQDVASACRTFLGECWYDRTQGVPYLQQIFDKNPPIALFQSAIVSAGIRRASLVSAARSRKVGIRFSARSRRFCHE